MNPAYSNFLKNAECAVPEPAARARVIALAIALSISNSAGLPTSMTDNSTNLFNMQVLPTAREVAATFNENMVFDCRACIDYVRMFWTIRYNAAHPSARPIFTLSCDFFESLFGIDGFVSAELHDFLEKYKVCIFGLMGDAAAITLSMSN